MNHTDLTDAYRDNVPTGFHPSHPRYRDLPCLRMDDLGKIWAGNDIRESIQMDYDGVPPSISAGRYL